MTHLPQSVFRCPSLTCRPYESHCQACLRTLWPGSLPSKCAREDRARDSRRLCNLLSGVTDRLADQLARGIQPAFEYQASAHMKIVLVNGRTPNPPAFCALRCESIKESH